MVSHIIFHIGNKGAHTVECFVIKPAQLETHRFNLNGWLAAGICDK